MKVIVYALVVGLTTVSAAVALQFHQLQQARVEAINQTCTRIAALDDTLIQLVRQGEKNVSHFQYYRDHPDELRIVIDQDEQTIHALTPPRFCN